MNIPKIKLTPFQGDRVADISVEKNENNLLAYCKVKEGKTADGKDVAGTIFEVDQEGDILAVEVIAKNDDVVKKELRFPSYTESIEAKLKTDLDCSGLKSQIQLDEKNNILKVVFKESANPEANYMARNIALETEADGGLVSVIMKL